MRCFIQRSPICDHCLQSGHGSLSAGGAQAYGFHFPCPFTQWSWVMLYVVSTVGQTETKATFMTENSDTSITGTWKWKQEAQALVQPIMGPQNKPVLYILWWEAKIVP